MKFSSLTTLLSILSIICLSLSAASQDSSIKYIMPYETDRLFSDQITEYQTYYTSEFAINTFAIDDLTKALTALDLEKPTSKVRKRKNVFAEELAVQEKLKEDLEFYLTVWLEIEEYHDTRVTSDFIETYNPEACYRLYTLYDTLEVSAAEIAIRQKDKSKWMEYPEAIDAEYIEDVRVIKPSSVQWVKKKADRNCQSADPNDCLVWCMVEVPAEVEVLSRTLNVISCPASYVISSNGERCEKEMIYNGQLSDASKEMAVFSTATQREVEVLSWEKITCR